VPESTYLAKVRNCYCGLWETAPSILVEQGVPAGYCGMCDVCGAPGHLRHGPGAMAATLSWCDKCYRKVAIVAYAQGISLILAIGAALYGARSIAVTAGLVFVAATYLIKRMHKRESQT
jgi:hypothetical protein